MPRSRRILNLLPFVSVTVLCGCSPVVNMITRVWPAAAHGDPTPTADLSPRAGYGGVLADPIAPRADSIEEAAPIERELPTDHPSSPTVVMPDGGAGEPEALSAFQTVPIRIAAE